MRVDGRIEIGELRGERIHQSYVVISSTAQYPRIFGSLLSSGNMIFTISSTSVA